MRVFLCSLAVFWFFATPAMALTVTVDRGTFEPLPIAIGAFDGPKDLAEDIRKVVEDDLVRSGLFRSLSRRAFLEDVKGVAAIPEFANWRQIDAQALLVGTVKATGDAISVEFRLWDVFKGQQAAGKSFSASRQGWRRVAHLVADEVYSRLTGEGPYFDSRIVYIAESGGNYKRPKKQLAIMDQDGANHRYLTSGNTLVLTPRFDPTSQRIIYMAYYNKKPSVYIYNLATGEEELLGNFPGMSFAPRFSPDGKYAIMSISRDGNSDIYEMDLSTRQVERLTDDYNIDTSPSYSPDSKRVVFNSDRGGSQQLYVMNRNGSGVKRISFGKGSYATPVWSPRGDFIAFTKMHRGKFYIGVMEPDGSGERLLTESYLDEGPTWSPNGRVIIFARKEPNYRGKKGRTLLYSVDLTGYNERRVVTPIEASDPAWSPLLSP